jgi:AraC family transcriptional regulator
MTVRIHFYKNIALCFAMKHQSNMHAHQALQMTVGLDGEFDFELEENGSIQAQRVDFACIAPQQKHKIGTESKPLAYLFADTSPVAYATWKKNGGIVRPPDAGILADLRALIALPDQPSQSAHDLAHRWYEHAFPGLIDIRPSDPRIARAIDLIDADPLKNLNHSDLAAFVHLSASRFANLFREQTGLPVRNYVLWRRLVYVFERLERGDSITTAAHNAGFSDCAHLSRSFHQIYGSRPSEIEMASVREVSRQSQ